MFEINTIQDFLALPFDIQQEVQKSIRAKDRLEDFLRTLNKKAGQSVKPTHEAHWEECPKCRPSGYPGYVFVEQSRDDSDIHPSAISKCLKHVYYACSGRVDQLEEFIEPRLRMLFDLGHSWHHTVQGYGRLGAWGDPAHYQKEVPIDPDAMTHDGTPALPIAHRYWIRGSADALISRYEIKNVPRIGDVAIRLIHEYKTMNSGQFSKLIRPKPEHKFQATIYSAVFNVPIVVYFYTNKDDSKMADFPVPFDTDIWRDITQKIERVQYYVENEIIPPWEETSAVHNKSECEECGFRKLCQPPLAQLRRA
jgi:CRISPR/Cas system-associated exonuclease Cas4 (RecB family)